MTAIEAIEQFYSAAVNAVGALVDDEALRDALIYRLDEAEADLKKACEA